MVDFGSQNIAPSFDDVADAVLLVESDVVVYGNRNAAQRLGAVNRHALIGQPVEFLLPGLDLRGKGGAIRTRLVDEDLQARPYVVIVDEIVISETHLTRVRVTRSPDAAWPPPGETRGVEPSGVTTIARSLMYLPAPLICTDLTGRVVEVHTSDGGLATPAIVGKRLPSLLEPEASVAFLAAMSRSAKLGSVEDLTFCHSSNGRRVTYEARLRATAHGDVYCILNDVTDRVRRDEHDLLSRKMESVSRMAGGIAHDFNNLLTAVIAHAELARLSDDGDGHHHIEQILVAADRAADLTRTLLAFSRSHLPGQDVIDADALIADLAQAFRALLDPDTYLTVHTGSGATIRADRRVLEQVLLNIVRNAHDALVPATTGPAKVAIAVRAVMVGPLTARRFAGLATGPHVLIAVRDNGVGMSEETASHIFEPFFTTHRHLGDTQHDGLGLAVAYGFANQSGGHIATITRLERGTTVLLYLPLSEALPDRIARLAHPSPRGLGQILLVEDEPAVREVFARSLSNRGYRVLEAIDGIDALRLMDQSPPPVIDALVTDLVMPRLGGHELAIRLRERTPGLKVLYMSGYTRATLESRDLELPGTRFLAKPFGPAELEEALNALVVETSVQKTRLRG